MPPRAARRSLGAVICFGVLASALTAAPIAVAGPPVHSSGRELWTARFSGHAEHYAASARAIGVSRDGSTVFVTGHTGLGGGMDDYATIAYRASTGRRLWKAVYDFGFGYNHAWSLAVAPDDTVLVTGESFSARGLAFGTIAYRGSDGRQLWAQQYAGGAGDNRAYAIAVSPDGTRVFVTGPSDRHRGLTDYATVAYNVATGAQEWVSLYDDPSHDFDIAQAIAVAPDGTRVFVTGNSEGRHGLKYDYGTVAYDAASGTTLWARRYTGPTHSLNDASAIVVAPDGMTAFVTGDSAVDAGTDILTVAYDASSGTQRWTMRYKGPTREGHASGVVVASDGGAVFVVGSEELKSGSSAFATLAYESASGTVRWADVDQGLGTTSAAASLAASPDGSAVYVTGSADSDYATAGYDSGSGARLWKVRYDGPDHQDDAGLALAVAPDGSQVFVTGESAADYLTVAYRAT
jgi:hypothetical protein